MATPKKTGIRIAAPILILSTCLLFSTAASAQTGGYMRALTSHRTGGRRIDGSERSELDSARQTAMPTVPQAAVARRDEHRSRRGRQGRASSDRDRQGS